MGDATDPAIVISESGNTLQSFGFTLTVTSESLSTDTQSVSGVVDLRPEVLSVQDVKATPGFVNAGASVDIVTDVANTVNEPTMVQATLQVLDSANHAIASAGPQTVALTVTSILATIDFGSIAIPSGTPNGNYKLSVTLTDASGNPLTGGTGNGYLLVGSPVTAVLSATPQTVPTGATTVLNTLTVTPTAGNANPLVQVGSVATASPAQTLALNGNTAYVCDENELSVVDITNPAAPSILSTALSTFITNAANIHCNIDKGDLVIFSDTNSTTIGNNPGFLVFGLSNPQSPNLINAVPFNKRFVGEPIIYSGNTAYLYTNVVFTQFGGVTGQGGDVVSVDLSTITNPTVASTLSKNGDPTYGGPSGFFGLALYNPNTLYATGTSGAGGTFTGAPGVLDVINVSDPTNISLSNQVQVKGPENLSSPLIQGNLLVTGGSTNGTPNAASVSIFDISDPNNPVLLSNTPTKTFCCAGGGAPF